MKLGIPKWNLHVTNSHLSMTHSNNDRGNHGLVYFRSTMNLEWHQKA